MRVVTAAERRARLGRRHRLAPGHGAGDPVEAARSVVALHATTPSSVVLSARARVPGMTVADLDRHLYADRTLVKHMAMRRTLWVVPRDLLGAVQAGASARVAGAESRRLVKEVEKAGLVPDGAGWLAEAEEAVVALLADGRELTSRELRAELPVLEGAIHYGEGRTWGGPAPIGPRVLTVASARGRIVRGSNDGAWTASRPRWTAMEAWLGERLDTPSPDDAIDTLVEVWLRAFGPGTTEDLRWWLGGTLTAVRAALGRLGAVEVDLEGAPGWLLPDDLEPEPAPDPWAALLPGLDPATMGWAGREWYLGPHRADIFDSAGNGGPTAWWDGRIVGGWRQDEEGRVVLQMLEDVGADGRTALAAEAEALSDWLGGVRVTERFPSPLSRRA